MFCLNVTQVMHNPLANPRRGQTSSSKIFSWEAAGWLRPQPIVKDTIVKDTIVKDTIVKDTIVKDTIVKDTIVKDTVVNSMNSLYKNAKLLIQQT